MASVSDLPLEQQEKVKRIMRGLATDISEAVHAAAHQLHEAVEQLNAGGSPDEFFAAVIGTGHALGIVVATADAELYRRLQASGVDLPDELVKAAEERGYNLQEPTEYRNEPGKRPRIVMPLGRA
jgi:predicted glycosyl hydrolase (DUF1957 family)